MTLTTRPLSGRAFLNYIFTFFLIFNILPEVQFTAESYIYTIEKALRSFGSEVAFKHYWIENEIIGLEKKFSAECC